MACYDAYLDDAMLQLPFSQIQGLEKRRLSKGNKRSGGRSGSHFGLIGMIELWKDKTLFWDPRQV